MATITTTKYKERVITYTVTFTREALVPDDLETVSDKQALEIAKNDLYELAGSGTGSEMLMNAEDITIK